MALREDWVSYPVAIAQLSELIMNTSEILEFRLLSLNYP